LIKKFKHLYYQHLLYDCIPPPYTVGPVAVITPGLVCTPGVIGSISPPIANLGLIWPQTLDCPKPCLPTTLGGPTGVTTPGCAWIPGVMGSASYPTAPIPVF
jgi:hypothetical protein